MVGLAGPYDTIRFHPPGLLGPDADDDLWVESDPLTHVAERPDVPFLLVHGEADDGTPQWFTTEFAAALSDAGHQVTVEMVPGADHIAVIRPPVIADLLVEWVEALAAEAA